MIKVPQPQTLAKQTIDAINALLHASDRYRDWNSAEVQTQIREIEKLQKVDARQAFVLFGALAGICGDVDGLLKYFKKALNLPDQFETKHEFWIALGNAGLYSNAQEIGTWLLDPKRGFFPKIWEQSVSIGQVMAVWNLLPEAKKTYPELSAMDFSNLERAVSVMEQHGLTDRHIVSVLDLIGEIQRSHKIMFSGPFASLMKVMRPPEDPPYLYFAIPMDAEVSELRAMNRELARFVVEKLPDGAFPQGMSASFAKAHPLELLAAA